jgi:hypothetical protein
MEDGHWGEKHVLEVEMKNKISVKKERENVKKRMQEREEWVRQKTRQSYEIVKREREC